MTGPRPERLGDLLRGYLAETGLDERLAEAEAVPDWAARVGAAIAGVTTPLRVSRGTLIVAVRSSVWLMELQMMERQIRDAVNAGRQRGRIQKIRFVMGGGDEGESRDERKT